MVSIVSSPDALGRHRRSNLPGRRYVACGVCVPVAASVMARQSNLATICSVFALFDRHDLSRVLQRLRQNQITIRFRVVFEVRNLDAFPHPLC